MLSQHYPFRRSTDPELHLPALTELLASHKHRLAGSFLLRLSLTAFTALLQHKDGQSSLSTTLYGLHASIKNAESVLPQTLAQMQKNRGSLRLANALLDRLAESNVTTSALPNSRVGAPASVTSSHELAHLLWIYWQQDVSPLTSARANQLAYLLEDATPALTADVARSALTKPRYRPIITSTSKSARSLRRQLTHRLLFHDLTNSATRLLFRIL